MNSSDGRRDRHPTVDERPNQADDRGIDRTEPRPEARRVRRAAPHAPEKWRFSSRQRRIVVPRFLG